MFGRKPCQTNPSTSGRVIRVSVTVGVEQAQLDALGDLAEQREVGAGAVVGGTERIGLAAPDLLRNGVGIRDLGQVAPFLVAGNRTRRRYGAPGCETWWMRLSAEKRTRRRPLLNCPFTATRKPAGWQMWPRLTLLVHLPQPGGQGLASTTSTPASRRASRASAVVVGDTPAVRSDRTLVVNPAATASAAVAFTQ